MAEKWTKTSSPFSRSIKPNPLAALNHFTVPVSFIFLSFFLCDRLPARIERERYSRDGTRTSKYVPTDSTACKGCKSLKRYHVCVYGYNCGFCVGGWQPWSRGRPPRLGGAALQKFENRRAAFRAAPQHTAAPTEQPGPNPC